MGIAGSGRVVGRYYRDDAVQIVYATSQYLIVTQGESPQKIAIKPVLSAHQAEQLGRRLLERESARGSRVELDQ